MGYNRLTGYTNGKLKIFVGTCEKSDMCSSAVKHEETEFSFVSWRRNKKLRIFLRLPLVILKSDHFYDPRIYELLSGKENYPLIEEG